MFVLAPYHWKTSYIRLHRYWWRMLETKCVGGNFKMLMTVLAFLITNINFRHQHSQIVTNFKSPTSLSPLYSHVIHSFFNKTAKLEILYFSNKIWWFLRRATSSSSANLKRLLLNRTHQLRSEILSAVHVAREDEKMSRWERDFGDGHSI